MNTPFLQEKGQFQLAFKGNEFVDTNTNAITTAKRALYLSGNYRIRLVGVQATTPWMFDNDQNQTAKSMFNGFPLLLLTSPQFVQTLTPDLPGPVFQWGTDYQFAPTYITQTPGVNLIHSQCQVGELLSTMYVAQLHNYIELQLRINDASTALNGQNAFVKPLNFAFNNDVVEKMSFIFTFYYERLNALF